MSGSRSCAARRDVRREGQLLFGLGVINKLGLSSLGTRFDFEDSYGFTGMRVPRPFAQVD